MSTPAKLTGRLAAQVHITVSPMPKNLHESKQILSALQNFGEVVTFRNLQVSPLDSQPTSPGDLTAQKYDVLNSSKNRRPILAIFGTSDAAYRAIASSPMRVTLAQSAIPQPQPPNLSSTSPSSPAANPNTTLDKVLVCTIQQSHHGHEGSMARNPFYYTYNIDKDSPIYADMASPETGVPLQQLADVLQRPKQTWPRRVADKIRSGNARMGAHSLMDLWTEGLANAEREEKHKEESRRARTGLKKMSLAHQRKPGVEDETRRGWSS